MSFGHCYDVTASSDFHSALAVCRIVEPRWVIDTESLTNVSSIDAIKVERERERAFRDVLSELSEVRPQRC